MRLESVNVGAVRTIDVGGRPTETAILKEPVAGPVPVRGIHVGDDVQAWTEGHGGPEQVAYAYAAEDTAWWSEQLGLDLGPGSMGENLTTRGLDVNAALIGEHWRIGSVVLRVSGPRIGCNKLAARLGVPGMAARFNAEPRPGAYLGVVQEGELEAGDAIEVVHRPDHDVTVAEVSTIHHRGGEGAARLLELEETSPDWREWAERKVSRAG